MVRLRMLLIYLKGIFMGVADVIPGVSGGTIALIVGIYRELIHALKSLNLGWVRPLVDLVFARENPEAFDQIKRSFERMKIWFLLPLVFGILTAIAIGSTFIPALLADYPVAVHALFFGLILASVWIPFRMVETVSRTQVPLAAFVGLVVTVLGFYVSNPNLRLTGSLRWIPVESQGQELKKILESVPSALPAHRVYWSSRNREFRQRLNQAAPRVTALMRAQKRKRVDGISPKETLKARSEPYENVSIPEGLSVRVPRLAHWYVFLVGSVAISAMILPGISGSYILLILGSYFFVLNAVHGFLDHLFEGILQFNQGLILVLFSLGALTGLLVFTRLLDYLLTEWVVTTAAGLSGLMIGCLRGIWPFRRVSEGNVILYFPDGLTASVQWALLMFVVGFSIVVVLSYVPGGRKPERTSPDD